MKRTEVRIKDDRYVSDAIKERAIRWSRRVPATATRAQPITRDGDVPMSGYQTATRVVVEVG